MKLIPIAKEALESKEGDIEVLKIYKFNFFDRVHSH